jgi:hypothetical protein
MSALLLVPNFSVGLNLICLRASLNPVSSPFAAVG